MPPRSRPTCWTGVSVAEYVPTTAQVANGYAAMGGNTMSVERSLAFDRWLEAHDRTERAAAWDEGYDTGCNDEAFEARGIPSDPGSKEHPHANPYRERGA